METATPTLETSVKKIVIRHLSGSRANQIDEFPIGQFRELSIGRDPACTVHFDADRDDLVGRHHAKIIPEQGDPPRFTLVDLDSRNGTYVNKQRIAGPVVIHAGDLVQFGPGGPEFMFDLEPRPHVMPKPTRMAGEALPVRATPETRAAATIPPPLAVVPRPMAYPTGPQAMPPLQTATGGGIGKATVERMVGQAKSESRGMMFLAIGVVAVVLAGLIGYLGYLGYRQTQTVSREISKTQGTVEQTQRTVEEAQQNAPMTPSQIATLYANSVVYIEVGWKLIYTPTGDQVYHRFVNLNGSLVPAFVKLPDGKIEPWLTTDKSPRPIGGEHSGTGFVVTNDGFILTNRHVAATWRTSYQFPDDGPGCVFWIEGNELMSAPLPQYPTDWVPAETRQTGRRFLQGGFEGRNDYMYVTFANKTQRIQSRPATVSDRHDVAMIKIDVPGQIKPVELNDNWDTIKVGDAVTVLGYPGLTPRRYGIIASKDVFNRETAIRTVPNVTLSAGNIGAILRGESNASTPDRIESQMGDSYQLTINSTGPGNSGGPVFDDKGRAIAIFNAGSQRVTYAVPARYGKELMTPTAGGR